jgi:2-methylcitrate dehydratase
MTIVEQLVAYAAGLRYEDLPAEVVRQAKRLIVDTVGCALGGYGAGPAALPTIWPYGLAPGATSW